MNNERLKTLKKKITTVTVMLFLIFVFQSSFAQTPLSTYKEKVNTRIGNSQYNKGDYADAEASYKKALDIKNNMPEATFNLGDAIYEQKRYEDAQKQFQLSAQTNDNPDIKAAAYHNLGNSFLQQKKYPEAVKAYKDALKINPNDWDTKYNLAYANEMLKQNKSGGQDNKEQKDKQEKKNEENKQSQDNKEQKQDQQQQQQQKEKEQKDKHQEGQQSNLSKEEAEKLLQALSNEEQKTAQKMQQKQMKSEKIRIKKDW